MEADHERNLVLTGHGLHVLRVTSDAVLHDLPGVLERLLAAARANSSVVVRQAHNERKRPPLVLSLSKDAPSLAGKGPL